MMPAHGLLGSDLRVRVRVCMLSRYTATGRRMRKHMRDGSRVLLLRAFTDWWERRGSWTLVSRSYVQAVPALLSVARRTLCASAGNRANEFETPPSSRANTNDHPRPSTASAIWGDISDHGGDRGRLVSQPRACAVHETTPLIQCCGHRERGRDWGVVGVVPRKGACMTSTPYGQTLRGLRTCESSSFVQAKLACSSLPYSSSPRTPPGHGPG